MHAKAGVLLASALSTGREKMEFDDRNQFEIQKMVDHILEIAANGLNWARERESER